MDCQLSATHCSPPVKDSFSTSGDEGPWLLSATMTLNGAEQQWIK